MHFTTPLTAVLLLAGSAAADFVEVFERCGSHCHRGRSIFVQENGTQTISWGFDANHGCRKAQTIPDMSYCWDWHKHRAHYYYGHYTGADRYCLVQDDLSKEVYAGCDNEWCSHVVWRNVDCTWDVSGHPKID